jgi:VanZ family protein
MTLPPLRKAALITAGVIYVLMIVIGSIPGEANELGRFFADYVLHFTAYGTYAALIAYGLGPSTTRKVLAVIVAIAVMGALDEAIQSTLSYRDADIQDWKVDMFAAFTVAIIYAMVSRRRRPAVS